MMRLSVFRESQRNFVWLFTKSRAWSNTTSKTTEQHAEQLVEKCKLTQSLISTGRLKLPCVNSRNQCKNYLPTSYTVQKHSTSIIWDQSKTLVNVCGTQSARQLCTITTFDSKDGTIDNHDNNSSSDSNIDEDVLTQDQDWVHPSTRQESILDKDPGLRSILGELASDFGKSDTGDPKNSETKSVNVCGDDHEVDGAADTYGVNLDYHDDIEEDEQHSETIMKPEDKKELTSDQSVFSISDVVEILHEENAKDICVIKVPKTRGYVDYFAVVTGSSNRHLRAMVSNLNKRYKEAKHSKDPFMKIEGKMADDWMCIDFGDIVVHFMMEETRELYELEMLWTLGPEYDTQYHRISEYQANVIQPVQLTEEELLEYEGGFEGSQETEGYSVIIEQDEESVDDIPSDKRI